MHIYLFTDPKQLHNDIRRLLDSLTRDDAGPLTLPFQLEETSQALTLKSPSKHVFGFRDT